MKLTPEVVQEVQRLLVEERLSFRVVAKRIGCSRASVAAIASRPYLPPAEDQEDSDWDDLLHSGELFQGPLARCPGCGAMVYLPCLLCRVRELAAQEAEKTSPDVDSLAPVAAGRIG
jgi:hypothetical protein